MSALFDDWTSNRPLASLGTNSGAEPLAFQGWHHFKEAFPPELIRQAIEASDSDVVGCFDPFGGSGTTALAAQFLGVPSTTVEVNPFLADVIRAKLAPYESDALTRAFGQVCRRSRRLAPDAADYFAYAPTTFIQPGADGRWLFDTAVAERIAAVLSAIDQEENENHRRFFRVLLGGTLVEASNVVVSGKGRRYRRNWQKQGVDRTSIDDLFARRTTRAIADVHRFSSRPRPRSTVLLGDARRVKPRARHSLAVFSPPYPNSFDYTDVYNIELWILGYLRDAGENRDLRQATLSSHVQLTREFAPAPAGVIRLDRVLDRLDLIEEELWSPWIPAMIGGYFADLMQVLDRVDAALTSGSQCWIVIGDSRYGGVHVPSGRIVVDLATTMGWRVRSAASFRSMRTSPQHGGRRALPETLVVLETPS
ncbi:MAG: hypothetical protein QOD92_1973 [Acidimicrobiaceae bacterium]|jgi:hypothetical protein